LELREPMVVCNEEYRFVIAEQLRQMSRPGRIVLEPCGRNTAPALTLAALAAVVTAPPGAAAPAVPATQRSNGSKVR
jgi:mannose-1-phosphate guanylyltransferase/mannose-6-phosphate isomerase